MSFLPKIKNTYLCCAFGIHPILCVWGLTFRKETDESPSFFINITISRLQNPNTLIFRINFLHKQT